MSNRAVGIDLGTTYSLVAAVRHGRPEVLAYHGETLLPSVVGFGPSGELLVGTPARNQLIVSPERTVRSIKRKMGSAERVRLGDREFTPQEISAFILRELKRRAEQVLGEPVRQAVITVPARFSDAQRQATRDAGEIAGLEVVRIINEPTAAALAYGIDRAGSCRALVYDLGGGTFDVSAIELSHGVVEVRASHGDPFLGGDDFDARLVDKLTALIENRYQVHPRNDRRAMARLTAAAERAKIQLSDIPYATVREEHILKRVHFEQEVSREEFEGLIEDLIKRTLDAIDGALADAGWRPKDLDTVLLVGGSTRIPRVAELVHSHLGIVPRSEIHPDEAVALGSAVQGAIIAGEPIDAVLVDICPYSLGIQTYAVVVGVEVPNRFSVVIPRKTAIPCSKTERFFTLYPDQDRVLVRVFQGEGYTVDQNTFLGEFEFTGISPNPSGGQREVLVGFDYDVDGIVHITAHDRFTKRKAGINVTGPKGRLSEDEKALAQATIERTTRESPLGAAIALRRRAEAMLANLREAGKTKEAEELARLVAMLDTAPASEAETTVMDNLIDWMYEHEEQ
ncbi:MAG: heat-shock protein Hsp70 [Chloroflexota bacterium]|nr:MAG: heat-shock protein Hsp70 [Chloroflexota bacterium]